MNQSSFMKCSLMDPGSGSYLLYTKRLRVKLTAQSPDGRSDVVKTGSCLCGVVSYEITRS